MISKHFDFAIVGRSLASRIAAALLAKQGCKVLVLSQQDITKPTGFHSSLFMEKLLGILGGRSCFIAQKPIQVISSNARITLCNDIPLDKELRREFAELGPAIVHWFEQLHSQGDQLERLLWENGGLPWPSLKATTRFKLLCLRHKVNWSEINAPILKSLAQLPYELSTFVKDLVQGLALKMVTELSRGQVALLFAQVMRPEELNELDLSQMLSKRFDQFHGINSSLEDLESIEFNGTRWTGGRLKGNGVFTAEHFLLGDIRCSDRFAPAMITALPSLPRLNVMTTSSLKGQLSPLLAARIICGGQVPLQLEIAQSDDELYGQLISANEKNETLLRQQLEPILPFARYQISQDKNLPASDSPFSPEETPQTLANLPLRIGTNLYCADNNALLAEMGAAGAALLGWTLAENLLNVRSQGKE
jgi:hypothetical protein